MSALYGCSSLNKKGLTRLQRKRKRKKERKRERERERERERVVPEL
jgi:hypothetical protein